MSGDVRLSIYRGGEGGGLQLAIEDDNGGYRILGAKFCGCHPSVQEASRVLDAGDVAAIQGYLADVAP